MAGMALLVCAGIVFLGFAALAMSARQDAD